MRGKSRTQRLIAAGFIGGVVVGLVVWSAQMTRSRRDLFSKNAIKRFAALGYLGGHPGVETARLLTEYVGWETTPVLRKRAERLLQRMKGSLV